MTFVNTWALIWRVQVELYQFLIKFQMSKPKLKWAYALRSYDKECICVREIVNVLFKLLNVSSLLQAIVFVY